MYSIRQFLEKEIESEQAETDSRRSNMLSGITHARSIQSALLPPVDVFNNYFPRNFILYRPRDIVSGDFYWIANKEDRIIFTVADCTGHGVPGAFLSLLGIALLNDIVKVHGIVRSDAIVSELRRRVIQNLQQQRKEITTFDGMDIALCVYDRTTGLLQYTGGMTDLVLFRDDKMQVIKADPLDVSISYFNLGEFTRKEIQCRAGDVFYLFTDGYQDQFGGEFDKKFLRPHFYATLMEVHRHPLAEQKRILEEKLLGWMRQHEQTDDITVIGIQI